MSYSLQSLAGVFIGDYIGDIQGTFRVYAIDIEILPLLIWVSSRPQKAKTRLDFEN